MKPRRSASARWRRPVPINEAEAVIDAFWDQGLSPLAHYSLDAGGETSGPARHACTEHATLGPVGPDQVRASQAWCWLTLAWNRSIRSTPVLGFGRQFCLDLSGYDRLVVRMSCPPHVRLTVKAVIDGREQIVVAGVAGRGALQEFEGRVQGRRLERIRLELATARDGPAEAWLDWIGCANAPARAVMLSRLPLHTADWEDYLHPEGAAVGHEVRFGFFFDSRELGALRRKALSPLYRPIMDRLRAMARAAVAAPRTPEMQIGPLIGCGDNSTTLVRVRDLATRSFHTDAPICAFVGLIDRDPVCLRFAARIAVCLAHAGTWAPHFMQEFPGTTWDQRGFPEAFAMAGVALALDWAGAWFTPKGEHLVRYAIAVKGLPRVRNAFLQYDYMLNCNQSHMIGLGRLLGLLVLERAWPRTRADIDVFEQDLFEIIDRYIQADGSTDEGLHYWNSTFRSTVPALVALARYRGRNLASMIPHKLRSMDRFIGALLSTTGEPGSYLPIADTVADSLALDAISMMAFATAAPLWRGLMADGLRRGKLPKAERWACDGPFAVIHGPSRLPAEKVTLPAFTRLTKGGHISSCRALRGGGSVRLFLVGAMANAGHSHRDKGSFILEADGEAFAIDRGMVPYHDSDNLPFLKSEVAHNLAVPEGCGQHNPSPVASVWRGRGDAKMLRASINTSGTWLAPVMACRRRVISLTPARIEIHDEFELAEARAVMFCLHSPLAMKTYTAAVHVCGRRLTLAVRAEWAVTKSAEPCGVNWCYTPVNRLALVSAVATHHRLVTVLDFALNPKGAGS